MDRKSVEILLVISAVLIFILLLTGIHSGLTDYESYGYVGILALFVLGVSVAGLKLMDME
jgi:hypothetical protein